MNNAKSSPVTIVGQKQKETKTKMEYKECDYYNKGKCEYDGGKCKKNDWDCPLKIDYYEPYLSGDCEEF